MKTTFQELINKYNSGKNIEGVYRISYHSYKPISFIFKLHRIGPLKFLDTFAKEENRCIVNFHIIDIFNKDKGYNAISIRLDKHYQTILQVRFIHYINYWEAAAYLPSHIEEMTLEILKNN